MERTVNDHLSDTSDKSTASASVDTYAAELTDVMERMDEALQDIAPWRVMHKMLDRGQEGLAEAKAILDDPDKLAAFIAANADDHQSDTSRKKIDQTEDKAERKRQQRREAQRRYREKITGKPQGRTRSTVEEMRERRDALYGIVREQQPMTVRQVFYQATVHNLVPKSQAGYEMVAYDLANMRKGGELPYGWIADNTRWMRKPRTATQQALRLVPQHSWTLLPGFVFTAADVAKRANVPIGTVQRVLDAFACPAGYTNAGFTSLHAYNAASPLNAAL
jgi:hypothetical protein